MASKKKKVPAAEAAVGLKQKSLLFFFSKHPPLQEALSQHASPRLEADEDDSRSSSLQDAGDSLRWSQLLTGWSPALESEPTPKDSGVDGGTPAHNKVDKIEGDVLNSIIEKRTPTLLSGSLNGKTASADPNNGAVDEYYTHYVTDRSDERETCSSLRPCKRRRNSRQSSHPCDDGENNYTDLELLEASAKCCQTTEARKEFHMYQNEHDEAFAKDCNEPVVLDSESIFSGSVSPKRGITNSRETNSHVLSLLSLRVLPNNSTQPPAIEVDIAFKLDADYENLRLSKSACGVKETTPLGSVQVDISNGNGKPGIMGVDVNKGCGNLKVAAATVDKKDTNGFCELKTVNGHIDLAATDMLGEGSSTLSLVATDSGTNLSFVKLKRGSGHRVSAPEEFLEAPLTDYEREREENILRNQHFMQKLGITMSALTTNIELTPRSGTKPKGKAIAKVKPPALPVRRSERLIQETTGPQRQDDGVAAEFVACDAAIEEEPLFYDDSSVLKYTCGDGVSISASYPSQELTKHGVKKIIGFHPLDGVLQDKYLTRIYTMSACFVSQRQRTLLAAGGHQGHIAVFGTTCSDVSMDAANNGSQEPLLSWKGSSCWISGVKFLSVQARESANLLLSSANDGKLVIWDINKQQKLSKPLAGLPPLKVTEAWGIHSNGIFSMDEFSGHVATASKDATVGYAKITNQEICPERAISGHHVGAIRGVNFRDASILADCGNDGLICILDLRMAEPCTLSIDTADATGVNVVEWCPSQEHLLLSASKDPEISLHDIRSTKEPLYKLSGHVNPKVQRCSQIYRPTFVAQGGAIVTPGQGSKALSLYSVDTGRAISRGHLGYDATMVMWTADCDESTSVLWVASRHISQLIPLWHTQG